MNHDLKHAVLAGMMLAVVAPAALATPPASSPRPAEVGSDSPLFDPARHFALPSDARRSQVADRPISTAEFDTHLPTIDEWLSDVEQKVDRQIDLFQRTERWGLWLIAVLYCLSVGAMGYFWMRISRLPVVISGKTPQSPGETSTLYKQRKASHVNNRSSLDGGRTEPRQHPRLQESELEQLGMDDRWERDEWVRNLPPQVRIYKSLVEQLAAGINDSRRAYGDVETGYALVGKITGEGPSRIITICGLIEAGTKARRLSAQVTFDREFQQQELRLLQMVDAEVMHIGDLHLHPGRFDRCSNGDYQTDVANVRASRSQEMVFGIVTAGWPRRDKRSDSSIWLAGLKFDFFYLGKVSGYQYARVVPESIDGRLLAVPAALRRFAKAFPERAVLDFDNLRRLRNYRMTVSVLPTTHGVESPCIEMTHKTRNYRTLILFSDASSQSPEVLVEIDGEITRFESSYLNGQFLPVVWFTPIVLEVERALTNRHGAEFGQNLPADTRSMWAGRTYSGPMGDSDGQFSTTQ